jgi:hypothetical protein
MLKTVLLATFTLAIAIIGGAASLLSALQAREGVGAIAIGEWVTYPDIGTPAADPYSRARISREGVLSLGAAEGLAFVAERDSERQTLRRNCSYRIEGIFPPARFWTLYASDEALGVLSNGHRRPPAFHAYQALRNVDNSLAISIGPHPVPGNWLPVGGRGAMSLVLSLYDTPVANRSGVADAKLPRIIRTGCDD